MNNIEILKQIITKDDYVHEQSKTSSNLHETLITENNNLDGKIKKLSVNNPSFKSKINKKQCEYFIPLVRSEYFIDSRKDYNEFIDHINKLLVRPEPLTYSYEFSMKNRITIKTQRILAKNAILLGENIKNIILTTTGGGGLKISCEIMGYNCMPLHNLDYVFKFLIEIIVAAFLTQDVIVLAGWGRNNNTYIFLSAGSNDIKSKHYLNFSKKEEYFLKRIEDLNDSCLEKSILPMIAFSSERNGIYPRLQLCLHNYYHYRCSEISDSGSVLYLVAAFDSLFSDDSNTKQPDIAKLVSYFSSENNHEFCRYQNIILDLYKHRNGIVHGNAFYKGTELCSTYDNAERILLKCMNKILVQEEKFNSH